MTDGDHDEMGYSFSVDDNDPDYYGGEEDQPEAPLEEAECRRRHPPVPVVSHGVFGRPAAHTPSGSLSFRWAADLSPVLQLQKFYPPWLRPVHVDGKGLYASYLEDPCTHQLCGRKETHPFHLVTLGNGSATEWRLLPINEILLRLTKK